MQPLPPIEESDAQRIYGVRSAEQTYRPWFEGKGRYPEWRFIISRISTQVEDGLGGLLLHMRNEMVYALVDAYEQLRVKEDKRNAQ